jgi:glutamine amidotransferase
MCRHVAYLGPPIALRTLLFDAPHSLCHQARGPKHQTSGESNPDGWGVGWHTPDGEIEHYRSTTPIWDDSAFAESAVGMESDALLAAARLASPGATIQESGNAPFWSGPWFFSLNGAVKDFHAGIGDELRARLSLARLAGIEGDSDSEVLFALTLDRLDQGVRAEDALAAVVDDVLTLTKARLNMLLMDKTHLAGTRVGNSLFVRAATVASEPLDDDPGWREVPEGSLVTAHAEPGHVHHNYRPL